MALEKVKRLWLTHTNMTHIIHSQFGICFDYIGGTIKRLHVLHAAGYSLPKNSCDKAALDLHLEFLKWAIANNMNKTLANITHN